MKLNINNELVDITTIYSGALTGELKIFNGDKVVFSATIGIDHQKIDSLSLEVYRTLLMVNPLQTNILNIEYILKMMTYITPNFSYSDIVTDTAQVIEQCGDVRYVYTNEVLTVADRVLKHKNPFFTEEDGEVYSLRNMGDELLYVTNTLYDEAIQGRATDLVSEEMEYVIL